MLSAGGTALAPSHVLRRAGKLEDRQFSATAEMLDLVVESCAALGGEQRPIMGGTIPMERVPGDGAIHDFWRR